MKKIALLVLVANVFCGLLAQSPAETSFIKYEQAIPGYEIKFTLVPIPAGTFIMGSSSKDKASQDDEMPQHAVSLNS
ncbi:MAG: formylglycine-generating enzyme family protein, partial [Chitinophagaceae bacterium]